MTESRPVGRCGCAGKTSLERVVRPARRRLRERLRPTAVRLAGSLESGLVPNSTDLRREPAVLDREAGTSAPIDGETATGHQWAVVASLTGRDAGADPDRFAGHMADALGRLPTPVPTVLAKGHALQLASDAGATAVGEVVAPAGDSAPGVRAINVDVIHGFPGLDPVDQAAVATAHAFNDVYAMGATANRSLRPLVGVPESADGLHASTVAEWFETAAPADIDVLAPVLVRHTGEQRVYGGIALGTTPAQPPVRRRSLSPGDEVLIHRPFGAVAAYAQTVAADATAARNRDAFLAALRDHHDDVARIVADHSPAARERPRWSRHVKAAVDVSGEGLLGLARHCRRANLSLELDALPFVDGELVEAARRRWLLPDATMGTNGPIATIGRPAVIERIQSALERRGRDARVVGTLIPGRDDALVNATDRSLAAFVESPQATDASPTGARLTDR